MTFVVTENCINCKFTYCVSVCPVDCFHEGRNFLVINPNECIHCEACVPECPTDAIKPEDEAGMEVYIKLNAKYAALWPKIEIRKEPLPDAASWEEVENKLKYLEK